MPKNPIAAEQSAIPAGSTPAADEHHGQGGAYELVDGKRVLVERTEPAMAAQPNPGA